MTFTRLPKKIKSSNCFFDSIRDFLMKMIYHFLVHGQIVHQHYIPNEARTKQGVQFYFHFIILKNAADYYIVLLLVQKYYVLVQIFCAIPKIDLHTVPVPNLLCKTKRWFPFSKFSFCAGTKLFQVALNFNSIFGLTQKI